jgi:hypothetical protein
MASVGPAWLADELAEAWPDSAASPLSLRSSGHPVFTDTVRTVKSSSDEGAGTVLVRSPPVARAAQPPAFATAAAREIFAPLKLETMFHPPPPTGVREPGAPWHIQLLKMSQTATSGSTRLAEWAVHLPMRQRAARRPARLARCGVLSITGLAHTHSISPPLRGTDARSAGDAHAELRRRAQQRVI